MGHVRIAGVGKAYKRYPRRSDRLREWCGFGVRHDLVWVLRDVSIDVPPGQAVGIVGANGAGKSTLLKIVTGTVQPTCGKVEVAGRVASLLELGIGFDPNFTGRQNAIMTANLLRVPITRAPELMGEIEAFAEIGDYMDQPLRTYSTGMQVRLAFSVATVVRPDVLIVDEALSVGDTYFQHKSFDRIRQFRDAGTTLLLVSHSPDMIKTLCDRAILLDAGLLLRDDEPLAVLDYYNALIAAQHSEHEIWQTERGRHTSTRSGNGSAMIESVDLLSSGTSVRVLQSGQPLAVRVAIDVRTALPSLTAGVIIRDRLGNNVFGTNTYHLGASRENVAAGQRLTLEFRFPEVHLGVGSYSVSVALHAERVHTDGSYDWLDRALVFQVVPGHQPYSVGVCALRVAVEWVEGNARDPTVAERAGDARNIASHRAPNRPEIA